MSKRESRPGPMPPDRRRTGSPLRDRVMVMMLVAGTLLLGAPVSGAVAPPAGPRVTELVTFASPTCSGQCGSGSTIGPDGALYVTDAPGGRLLRIDPRTGAIRVLTTALPASIPAVGIGGAVDVAFLGGVPYVLVTLVGPAVGQPDTVSGLYRVRSDGGVRVVADIGAWSTTHPPATDFAVASGVQYAMTAYRGGFLITDGHHNRVLHVSLSGRIVDVQTLDNTVPTGLDTVGGRIYVAEAGPVPHRPETGRVITWTARAPRFAVVAAGAPLAVDVEVTHGNMVWVLSQGSWDHPAEPQNAGLPASPDTGSLLRLEHGRFSPVVRGLDRPTSLELVPEGAYVVTLTGKVLRIAGL